MSSTLDTWRTTSGRRALERGLSRAALGDALSARQTVNAIETGRYDPSLPLAFTLARFFATTIEELFSPDGADRGCRRDGAAAGRVARGRSMVGGLGRAHRCRVRDRAGRQAGLLIGGAMVALVAVLRLGRRRIDAVRVVGGAGDERNQLLSTQATAVTSGVLVMVMTGWFLVSAALGEPNETLMILLPLYLVVQVVSSAYLARRG